MRSFRFYLAQAFRVRVRTASGSDRIIRFRGIVRLPSLPLRVLTRVLTHSLNDWASEKTNNRSPMRVKRDPLFLDSQHPAKSFVLAPDDAPHKVSGSTRQKVCWPRQTRRA